MDMDIHGYIHGYWRFWSYPWILWISISKSNFEKYFKQCVIEPEDLAKAMNNDPEKDVLEADTNIDGLE